MKTYIKHHFAAIITLLVLAATQAFAAETSLLSDYTPNGESFQYYVNTIDFQKQTFKAVLVPKQQNKRERALYRQ